MPQTQAQLNNVANPIPVTYNISTAGLYRDSGDFGSQIYYRDPVTGKVSNFSLIDAKNGLYDPKTVGAGNQAGQALQTLKSKYGFDYWSLPSVNIADRGNSSEGLYTGGIENLLKASPAGMTSTTVNGPDVKANVDSQLANLPPNTANATNAATPSTTTPPAIQGQQTPEQVAATEAATGQKPVPQGTTTGYQGPSIVDYLASTGQASDFASRSTLAQANGIANYTGTAAQNTQLLTMLRSQGGVPTGTNASGITSGGTMGGTTSSGSSNTSGTSAPDPYAGMDPVQKQIAMYTEASTALGLPTIKQQYQDTLDKQKEITDKMNTEITDVNNDPWLSEGVRTKEIQKIQDKYKTDLSTQTNLATLYDSLYKQGQAQVEKIVSGAEADVKATNDLAQKQLDAATALAKDNQVVSIGGNEVLVNKETGKTVAILGPSPKSTTTTNTTQMNDDVQNAVSQLQQIVKTKNFAGIDPGDYQIMADYLQKTYGTKAVSALKTAISALGLSVDVVGDGKGAN